MRLAAQEATLPGTTLAERYAAAKDWGFDGIEVAVPVDGSSRRDELTDARASGVVISSAVVASGPFIGDPSADVRELAIARLSNVLDDLGAAGVPGLVMPFAFGIQSRHLGRSLRSAPNERAVAVRALRDLARRAAASGTCVFLEPLNRYEDHLVNTVGDAFAMVNDVHAHGIAIVADTFHMSIEEVSVSRALRSVKPRLAHIQLGDSNRLEPGAGHTDWAALFRTLAELDYDGWLAMECGLSGRPEEVLPRVSSLLRRCMAENESAEGRRAER